VIVIHDHNEIVQLSVRSKHGCLPDLSLLDLAVAQERIYSVIITGQLSRNCHTYSSGNSLSERTGRHIDTRYAFHIRMSLKIGPGMTQCNEIFFREKASLRQSRIQSRRSMSF